VAKYHLNLWYTTSQGLETTHILSVSTESDLKDKTNKQTNKYKPCSELTSFSLSEIRHFIISTKQLNNASSRN